MQVPGPDTMMISLAIGSKPARKCCRDFNRTKSFLAGSTPACVKHPWSKGSNGPRKSRSHSTCIQYYCPADIHTHTGKHRPANRKLTVSNPPDGSSHCDGLTIRDIAGISTFPPNCTVTSAPTPASINNATASGSLNGPAHTFSRPCSITSASTAITS